MMPYPPLGTLYAAAAVRDAGYDATLFDSMLADSEDELLPLLKLHTPQFLVIYDDDFNYLTKMCLTRMREAAFRMAELAKARGCSVIVHGSDATDHLDLYFDHCADYILIGEAEATLCELLDALHRRSPDSPEDIPGVAFRDHNGDIRRGPKREVLRDLDSLPFPARDLVDIDRYRAIWMERHGYFSLNIATTRGCPFHCNWCAKPLYGQVYNSRSPESVAREIRLLKETCRPDHLWICDDIFGLTPGWVEEFSRELQRLDAVIPFKCLSRADLILRGNTARALADAGCGSVWIGAESGAQKILDAMDKGITVEQIHRATECLRSFGIRVGFFLQFGYPGEREREIEATIAMVRRLVPEEIGISVSYPLPGTRFHERVLQEMGEKRNWSESGDLAMMFRGAFGTGFYRILVRHVHQDHRLHQGLRALRMLLRGVRPDRRGVRRMLLIPYHAVASVAFAFLMNRRRRPPRPGQIMLPVKQAPVYEEVE